jgi:voltage-gated potassium channel
MEYYIDAASWAFTTVSTVGYGDFYAVSDSEKVFAMVAMVIACGVFATIVGSISSIIDK